MGANDNENLSISTEERYKKAIHDNILLLLINYLYIIL